MFLNDKNVLHIRPVKTRISLHFAVCYLQCPAKALIRLCGCNMVGNALSRLKQILKGMKQDYVLPFI